MREYIHGIYNKKASWFNLQNLVKYQNCQDMSINIESLIWNK